jgi:hypothetical protein
MNLKGRQQAPDVTAVRVQQPGGVGRNGSDSPQVVGLAGERVVQHSPDGYEWGYGGSGPADFALNILHRCLPPGCDGEEPVPLYRGQCSLIAWQLHQDFKRDFVARLPEEGGLIAGEAIDRWIDDQLDLRTSAADDPPQEGAEQSPDMQHGG